MSRCQFNFFDTSTSCLAIEQGADWKQTITWDIDGTPIDITGYSAQMDIVAGFDDITPQISLSTGNGRIVLADPTNGILDLSIAGADTALLTPGSYYYDLLMTSASSEKTSLLNGKIQILPRVTGV